MNPHHLSRAFLCMILFFSGLSANSESFKCADSFQIKATDPTAAKAVRRSLINHGWLMVNGDWRIEDGLFVKGKLGIITVPLENKILDKFAFDLELLDENIGRDIAWLIVGFDRYVNSDVELKFEVIRDFPSIVVRFANRQTDYGDLEDHEITRIQQVVDKYDRQILVVGSTMGSRRRNRGADAVIGKGENEKSDIDYMVLPPEGFSITAIHDGWEGEALELLNKMGAELPDIDLDLPIITSVPNLKDPAIIFRPKQNPLVMFRESI